MKTTIALALTALLLAHSAHAQNVYDNSDMGLVLPAVGYPKTDSDLWNIEKTADGELQKYAIGSRSIYTGNERVVATYNSQKHAVTVGRSFKNGLRLNIYNSSGVSYCLRSSSRSNFNCKYFTDSACKNIVKAMESFSSEFWTSSGAKQCLDAATKLENAVSDNTDAATVTTAHKQFAEANFAVKAKQMAYKDKLDVTLDETWTLVDKCKAQGHFKGFPKAGSKATPAKKKSSI